MITKTTMEDFSTEVRLIDDKGNSYPLFTADHLSTDEMEAKRQALWAALWFSQENGLIDGATQVTLRVTSQRRANGTFMNVQFSKN